MTELSRHPVYDFWNLIRLGKKTTTNRTLANHYDITKLIVGQYLVFPMNLMHHKLTVSFKMNRADNTRLDFSLCMSKNAFKISYI